MNLSTPVTIVAGHYGCGKTNLSVNLAVDTKKKGLPVTLADLDIVNPYFRSADFTAMLEGMGIRVIAPLYAGSNLDIPALTGELDAALAAGEGRIILDVGGDDAGAVALGRYAAAIAQRPYTFFYVINPYRYLTASPEEAAGLLGEIEAASRLKATGLIHNPNLGSLTDRRTLEEAVPFAEAVSRLTGLPLAATAVPQGIRAEVPLPCPVAIYVKKSWEE